MHSNPLWPGSAPDPLRSLGGWGNGEDLRLTIERLWVRLPVGSLAIT